MAQDSLSWADYHPEVVEAFDNMTPWPCERITTELGPCSQPTLAMGPDEELVVDSLRQCEIEEPGSRTDKTAFVYHSTDGGLTWGTLCEIPMDVAAPEEAMTVFGPRPGGIGFLRDGTLLASIRLYYANGKGGVDDETVRSRVWVVRSTDRGKTWSAPFELDPSPLEAMGGNRARFHERPDGTVLLPMNCTRYARPGKPLSQGDVYETAQIYASADGGQTWRKHGDVGKHSDESDFLSLSSGRILASTRYQRRRMPGDPPELGKPGGEQEGSIYKQTVICHSDDGGSTFSDHLLMTGWLQQTACLVQLSDGTVVMPFGHKDEKQGQRFLVSYDEGQTWGKTVFELNKSGMYASSAALSDDTIVTAYAVEWHSEGRNRLEVLRWKAPPRDLVEKKGFFAPRPAAVRGQ